MMLFGRSRRKSGGSISRDVGFAEAISCRRHGLHQILEKFRYQSRDPLHRKVDGVPATPLELPSSLLSSACLLPGQ